MRLQEPRRLVLDLMLLVELVKLRACMTERLQNNESQGVSETGGSMSLVEPVGLVDLVRFVSQKD